MYRDRASRYVSCAHVGSLKTTEHESPLRETTRLSLMGSNSYRIAAPSMSAERRPLTAVTRVRIPYALPTLFTYASVPRPRVRNHANPLVVRIGNVNRTGWTYRNTARKIERCLSCRSAVTGEPRNAVAGDDRNHFRREVQLFDRVAVRICNQQVAVKIERETERRKESRGDECGDHFAGIDPANDPAVLADVDIPPRINGEPDRYPDS